MARSSTRAALVAALRDGTIAGAGLDVYEDEPRLAPGLADLPNTVLLPHIGSATTPVRARMAELCAENAVAMAHATHPAVLCQSGSVAVKYIHDMATDESAVSSKQQPLLVLGKITEILDAFSLAQPAMSLGEIQQATGLPTSTVQRLVSNMVAQGFLDRDGDRIRVGVRMSYWAATALKDLDVLAVSIRSSRRSATRPERPRASSRSSRTTGSVSRSPKPITRFADDMYVGKVIPLHVGSA